MRAPPSEVRRSLLSSNGVTFILAAAGAVLRIWHYLSNRSLWIDEAMLATNILKRPWAELAKPLDFLQAAPIGFLYLEKSVTLLLGPEEHALRLIPLIAGLVSLVLFVSVARRTLAGVAIPIAVGLFAFCGPLLYYSSEAKQYSSDVAIALLLILLSLQTKQGGAWWPIALTGSAAIWFSYPATFVVAGAGLTLLACELTNREQRRLIAGAAAAAFCAASFVAAYFVSFRATAGNPGWKDFWSSAFAPAPPRSLYDLLWFPRAARELFTGPAGFDFPGLAIFAFVVGSAACLAADRGRLALLVSPIALALIASGLHRYPFSGRLLLFCVPALLLLVGEGSARLLEATRGAAPVAGAALLALLFLPLLLQAARDLRHPGREEIRPVLDFVRRQRKPGDSFYVYHGARPAFDYYSPRYGFTARDVTMGVAKSSDWNVYRADLDRLSRSGRTWVVFSHVTQSDVVDERSLFLHFLDDIGTRLDASEAKGAAAYLYDLRRRGVAENAR